MTVMARRVLIGALIPVLVLSGTGQANAGTPGTATWPTGSVTCTVADVYLDGPDWVPAVMSCSYTSLGFPLGQYTSWMLLPEADDGTLSPVFLDRADLSKPVTGTTQTDGGLEDTIDGDGGNAARATISLSGEVSILPDLKIPFSVGTYVVHRSKSRVQKFKVKKDNRFVYSTRVSARVMAVNSKGKSVPIDGDVVIEFLSPGSRIWRAHLDYDSALSDTGFFEGSYPKFVRGTKLRVSVVDCLWCTDASSKPITVR